MQVCNSSCTSNSFIESVSKLEPLSPWQTSTLINYQIEVPVEVICIVKTCIVRIWTHESLAPLNFFLMILPNHKLSVCRKLDLEGRSTIRRIDPAAIRLTVLLVLFVTCWNKLDKSRQVFRMIEISS